MLVCDKNRVERSNVLANSGQALGQFPPADARIDEQPGTPGGNENRVAGATAGENADLYDKCSATKASLGLSARLTCVALAFFVLYHQTKCSGFVLNGHVLLVCKEALAASYNIGAMNARVYVTIKPTVLDPQGQTICGALQGLGHAEVTSVRQGKYFEVGLRDGVPRETAAAALEAIARDVLSNPVIEDYRIDILD